MYLCLIPLICAERHATVPNFATSVHVRSWCGKSVVQVLPRSTNSCQERQIQRTVGKLTVALLNHQRGHPSDLGGDVRADHSVAPRVHIQCVSVPGYRAGGVEQCLPL